MARTGILVSTGLILAAAMAAPALAEGEPHEHGHATMQIAVEGNTLSVALELPGDDAVGFETEPSTDEDRAALAEAKEKLADPLAVLDLPEAAGCVAGESASEYHVEGEHAAMEVEYELNCENVAAIETLGTRLFELFPSVEEVEVEYALPSGQGGGELSPGAAAIELPAV